MSLDEKFQNAVEAVRQFQKRPNDDELLEIYGFFKQATVGDCNIEKPSALKIEATKKWESWNSNKGMSTVNAKENYVKRANELLTVYGQNFI